MSTWEKSTVSLTLTQYVRIFLRPLNGYSCYRYVPNWSAITPSDSRRSEECFKPEFFHWETNENTQAIQCLSSTCTYIQLNCLVSEIIALCTDLGDGHSPMVSVFQGFLKGAGIATRWCFKRLPCQVGWQRRWGLTASTDSTGMWGCAFVKIQGCHEQIDRPVRQFQSIIC